MYLIKHSRQDLAGNVLDEEILPEIFMTTAQCSVLMERISSQYDISDYSIHHDRWWGRSSARSGEIHFWWAASVQDMLRHPA